MLSAIVSSRRPLRSSLVAVTTTALLAAACTFDGSGPGISFDLGARDRLPPDAPIDLGVDRRYDLPSSDLPPDMPQPDTNPLLLTELQSGDGRLLFGHVGGAFDILTWVNGTGGWRAELALPAVTGEVLWAVTRFAAVELTVLKADLGTARSLQVWEWLGAAWYAAHDLRSADRSRLQQRDFDVEVERISGDALLVYGGDDVTPSYLTRSAGSWSGPLPLPLNDGNGPDPDLNSGKVLWVELVPHPTTNEIALLYADSQQTLAAMLWDGNQWRSSSAEQLSTDLKTNAATGIVSNRAFDGAYERASEDLLVVWGTSLHGMMYARYTGSWGPATYMQGALEKGSPHFVDLAADPRLLSNDVALMLLDLGDGKERLALGLWDGISWQGTHQYVAQIRDVNDTATGDFPGAVAWAGQSGRAVAVYPADQSGTLDWYSWSDGDSEWQAETGISVPGKGFTESVVARPLPAEDQLLFVLTDEDGALFAALYDATGWIVTHAGAPLATSLGTDTVPFALELHP